jgi:hypothetical protein
MPVATSEVQTGDLQFKANLVKDGAKPYLKNKLESGRTAHPYNLGTLEWSSGV